MPTAKARAEAIRNGMCRICCIRKPSGDHKCCDVCIGRNKKRTQLVSTIVWCGECLAMGFHRAECRTLRVVTGHAKVPRRTQRHQAPTTQATGV